MEILKRIFSMNQDKVKVLLKISWKERMRIKKKRKKIEANNKQTIKQLETTDTLKNRFHLNKSQNIHNQMEKIQYQQLIIISKKIQMILLSTLIRKKDKFQLLTNRNKDNQESISITIRMQKLLNLDKGLMIKVNNNQRKIQKMINSIKNKLKIQMHKSNNVKINQLRVNSNNQYLRKNRYIKRISREETKENKLKFKLL